MPGIELAVAGLYMHRAPLTAPCRELWVIAGRRGGKSNVAAAIAIYLATLKRWKLSTGEVGTVMVLATDRDQAKAEQSEGVDDTDRKAGQNWLTVSEAATVSGYSKGEISRAARPLGLFHDL